jgi:hypothetical protein
MHERWDKMFVLTAFFFAALCFWAVPTFAQVSPAEIHNPRLKAAEKNYLSQLVALKRDVARLKFPFAFTLSRYAGLDPKEQVGADERGLEFVNFQDRMILKLTGNYNAAFNVDVLTANERADRVFSDVIQPILGLLTNYFSTHEGFDGFGFEISYHARRKAHGYEYEGKENVVVVMGKQDALSFSTLLEGSKRQEALNRSEVFLNGKDFGLALGQKDALDVEELNRSTGLPASSTDTSETGVRALRGEASTEYRTLALGSPEKTAVSETPPVSPAALSQADAETLQQKLQPQLDVLNKEGAARFHFVDYAPPSIVVFQNKLFLQLTLRNPAAFEKDFTSIYKRAAQSFDLFLAPLLKPILDKMPETSGIGGIDVTVLNDLSSKPGHSSEALEFAFPLKPLRQFVNAEITNQELINQSVVLVNGVRIALDLQRVE